MASLFIISLLSPLRSIASGTAASVPDFVPPTDETNLFIPAGSSEREQTFRIFNHNAVYLFPGHASLEHHGDDVI